MSRNLIAIDPALAAQQHMATVDPVAPAKLEWLLMVCGQDPQLFAEANELIRPHYFSYAEGVLGVAWTALCESYRLHNGVTYESLYTIANDYLRGSPEWVLSDTAYEVLFENSLDGLLYSIATPGLLLDAVNVSLARSILRGFIYERSVVDPLQSMARMLPAGRVPELTALTTFLSTIDQQNTRLSTMHAVPEVAIALPVGAEIAPSSEYKLTGLSYFDTLLGGQRVGDANCIVGPTGGGKTTLAVHLAVATAKQCWNDAQETQTEPELVIYVCAEESARKMRARFWSCFFEIPRDKLEKLTSWSELTTAENLAPYELQLNTGPHHLSETERYMLHAPQMEQCLTTLDLSGSDDFPEAGRGGLDEIVSYISRIVYRDRSRPRKLRSVIIDYAGLVCERYMAAKGIDENKYRHVLKRFGDMCRMEIAEKFGCTAWILQQLRGGAGASSPMKLMTHADIGESKDFAANMAMCACLGVEDPRTGCRRLNFSKVRTKEKVGVPPLTLKIHPLFARMEDVGSQYRLDEQAKRFISNEEQQQIRSEGQHHTIQRGPRGVHTTELTDVTQNPDV